VVDRHARCPLDAGRIIFSRSFGDHGAQITPAGAWRRREEIAWSPMSRKNIRPASEWATGRGTIHHRDDYDQVQREFREISSCPSSSTIRPVRLKSARRRKRNQYPDPAKRAFINDLVCEGCGDCGVKSNCVSVLPLETEFRSQAHDRPVVLYKISPA